MKKRRKQEAKKSPRGKNERLAMFSSTFLQMWPSMLPTKASQAQNILKTKAQSTLSKKGTDHAVNKGFKGTAYASKKGFTGAIKAANLENTLGPYFWLW